MHSFCIFNIMSPAPSKKPPFLVFGLILFFSMTWNPVPVYPANGPPGSADPGHSRLVLDMEAGQVRLYAQNVRLSEILRLVANKTGITVMLDQSADRSVSFDIGPVPLDRLIRIILRELNYAELWKSRPDPENHGGAVLTKLFVYPKGKSAMGEEILILAGQPLGLRADDERQNIKKTVNPPAKSVGDISNRLNGSMGALIQKQRLLAYLKKKRNIKKGVVVPAPIPTAAPDKFKTFSAYMAKLKSLEKLDRSTDLTRGKMNLP